MYFYSGPRGNHLRWLRQPECEIPSAPWIIRSQICRLRNANDDFTPACQSYCIYALACLTVQKIEEFFYETTMMQAPNIFTQLIKYMPNFYFHFHPTLSCSFSSAKREIFVLFSQWLKVCQPNVSFYVTVLPI